MNNSGYKEKEETVLKSKLYHWIKDQKNNIGKSYIKRICILFVLILLEQNVFAYNYVKNFYNWRGDNVYKVCATNTAFTSSTYHLVQVNDLNNHISRNFICKNKEEVMELYEIICRMNTATLEEVVRSTKWKFWFQADNGWLFYSDAGSY